MNKGGDFLLFPAKGRRGMSAVIVTLLLVMLSIVLVGVVFVVINNIVKSGTQQVASSSQCLASGVQVVAFSCMQDGSQCNVTVKRTSGNDQIGGVELIFTNDNQDSNVSFSKGNIVTLATRKINATNIGVSNITNVGVSVYFADKSGKPVACSIVSQAEGSIGSGTTGTGGGGSVSGPSSGGGITGNTVSCAPAQDTLFDLCGNYQCGQVANGTCPQLVTCGSCNPTTQYCDLSTHQCANNPPTCTPAADPTLAGLCTVSGTTYQCGTVQNGTGCGNPDVTCGTCSGTDYCDLSTHQCVPQSQCSPAPSDFCTSHSYQCGLFNNGTCSGTINCSDSSLNGGTSCASDAICSLQTNYQCMNPIMLNNGTINSVWPPDAPRFFDSNNLPNKQNYPGDSTDTIQSMDYNITYNASAYTGTKSYVRFPGSNETRCLPISSIIYQNSTDTSFVQISLAYWDYANITAGDNYRIWSTLAGCQSDPVT